uniref:Putative secreted protein n=1 Tax=Ixodes ricinus TaxID=34613 RepID=A0A6B0U5E5_IXORI
MCRPWNLLLLLHLPHAIPSLPRSICILNLSSPCFCKREGHSPLSAQGPSVSLVGPALDVRQRDWKRRSSEMLVGVLFM